jgi:endonuclease/exonuclease/phosphatase family metal-dependent hydrolase
MALRRRGLFKTDKILKFKILSSVFFLLLLIPLNLSAITFKVASYNVENLFDLNNDAREYPEYIPFTGFKWDNVTYHKKIENIAKVLCDLDAHIVGLQEIESESALRDLINTVKNNNCRNYKYYAIVKDSKEIPIRPAIVSVFPILKKKDIKIPGDFRDILRTDINIEGKNLTIFVNHWKSKRWPEKHRLIYAKKLMSEIKELKKHSDYMILGDFNSNYDEFRTIKYNNKLNNTKGITGINHILKTVSGNMLIDKFTILEKLQKFYHYNLWLEIDKYERFSYLFRNKRETPDSIIISSQLFDEKNISYVDRSFGVFKPAYLINNNVVNRWKRAKSGKAWHTGEGYSDHLPIYAYFTDGPFKIRDDYPTSLNKTITEIYSNYDGDAIIRNAVVIYENKNSCVIKRENDKAIYCYKCLDNFKLFNIYDLFVHRIKKFKGLPEITSANIIRVKGSTEDVNKFYIECNENTNFINNINDVCRKVEGIYKNNYLYMGKQKIKLYITKNIKLKNNSKLILEKVRIGFFKEPEIIVEDVSQIKNEY